MDKLVIALGPVFAAGLAVQQFLEFLSPLVDKLKWDKKTVMGLASVSLGFILTIGAGLRVLQPLGAYRSQVIDVIVTGLIISAGTEGLNSVMKFLGYAKEKKKSEVQEG